MGEMYHPYPKLPRNIRQIGEKEDTAKVYFEDYVSTYLKSLSPAGEERLRVGFLLGSLELREGVPFVFLDGAMEIVDAEAFVGKVDFSQEVWKKSCQEMEKLFPKRSIQGWFLCAAKGSELKSVDYWKTQGKYFAGKHKLMHLNHGEEGEEELYIEGEEGLKRLKGYCIYYERNQMMQDYMVLRSDRKRTEAGVHDQVTRDFKDRMAERKGQIQSQKSTVRMLAGVCGALSLAVMAGGIVMFNNYSQMRQMESVIASVLPSGSFWDKEESGESEGQVEIQMVSGGVYPTEAATAETQKLQINGSEEESTALGEESQGSENREEIGNENKENEKESGEKELEGKERNEKEGKEGEGNESRETVQVDAQVSSQGGGNQTAAQADSGIWEWKDVASGETRRYYTVGEGETLYGICLKLYHNLSNIDTIIALNGLESQDKIIAGQKLQLP
ncbi:MAG: LysM peptidoglycan-binding domain-containing protein [bacterium]|nr:LysM peptidoglycan-binding domain-containing protein [bacterium]